MAGDAYAPTRVCADEVHEARQENVWIHDAMVIEDHSMTAGFSIPVWRVGEVRFAELMEVQRQMAMLQLHRQAGVSVDAVFIVDRFSLRLVSQRPVGSEGTIHSHLVGSKGSRGRVFVQRLSFEMAGGVVAVGESHAKALPRGLYERLRSRPAPAITNPVSPQPSAGRGEVLTVDRQDPLLSDHESDHITAVQIIAAVENAIVGADYSALSALDLAFARYTEPEPTPELIVEELSDGQFRGSIDQDGVSTAIFSGQTLVLPSPQTESGNA